MEKSRKPIASTGNASRLTDEASSALPSVGRIGDIEGGATNRAMPGEIPCAKGQDDLSVFWPVETFLTHVVLRLRADWISHMGASWPSVCAVNELAGSEIEKRVARLLRDGFADFGQFLCGLEVFLLQGKQLHVVGKEAVLGLENLGIQITDDRCDLIELMHGQGGLAEFLRCLQRRKDGADHGNVHGNPLQSGVDGCGDCNSTAKAGSHLDMGEAP